MHNTPEKPKQNKMDNNNNDTINPEVNGAELRARLIAEGILSPRKDDEPSQIQATAALKLDDAGRKAAQRRIAKPVEAWNPVAINNDEFVPAKKGE